MDSSSGSSAGTRFASLPSELLGTLTSFLYPTSIARLFQCGNRALNTKMDAWGGVHQLRFHIGHRHVFDSRGSEHRGHFTSVPLHFPIQGISYEQNNSQIQRLLQCFPLVNRFSKLRVLSIYSYRTFSPQSLSAPIHDAIDLPFMCNLPGTLEVIEFRFPYSIACFLADRHNEGYTSKDAGKRGLNCLTSQRQWCIARTQLIHAFEHKVKWLPLHTQLPNLKTLSVWSDWENIIDSMPQVTPTATDMLQKSFLLSLPPDLENLDVDFVHARSVGACRERAERMAKMQTLVLHTQTRQFDWDRTARSLFAVLPRNLIRLDIPTRSLGSSLMQLLPTNLAYLSVQFIEDSDDDSPLPFPPHLEKISTSSSEHWTPHLVSRLPKTLQVFQLRKCDVSHVKIFGAVIANSVVFDRVVQSRPTLKFKIDSYADLYAGMQHFRIAAAPALKTDLVAYTPLFASLRSLVLTGCFLSESCLLALPRTLCLLEVELIRSSGILLDPATTIVDETSVTTSTRSWCHRQLPLMQAVPQISCINILHVPPTVEDILIEYSAVNVYKLTHLKRLAHYSAASLYSADEMKMLPSSITELDWRGAPNSLMSASLSGLPPTVTRLLGGCVSYTIFYPFDWSRTDCRKVSFPDDIAKLQDKWSQVEMIGTNMFYESKTPKVKVHSFPHNMEELTLQGTGRAAYDLTGHPIAAMSYSGQTLFCDLDEAKIEHHSVLKKVTLLAGASGQYPLSQLPPGLTALTFDNHIVRSDLFKQIARFTQLETLEIRGEVYIKAEDLAALPPSLTTLSMTIDSLTAEALPFFPKGLTSIQLGPKSTLTPEMIQAHIASKSAV